VARDTDPAPAPRLLGSCASEEHEYTTKLPFLTDEWNLADGLNVLARAVEDFIDDGLCTEGRTDIGLFLPWLRGEL
jgi:hypothetical protein